MKNIFEDFKNIANKSNFKMTKLAILEESIKLVDRLSCGFEETDLLLKKKAKSDILIGIMDILTHYTSTKILVYARLLNNYSLSFPPRIGVRGKLQRESRRIKIEDMKGIRVADLSAVKSELKDVFERIYTTGEPFWSNSLNNHYFKTIIAVPVKNKNKIIGIFVSEKLGIKHSTPEDELDILLSVVSLIRLVITPIS
ncbi:MAG: hypothetical protein AABY84_09640 [Candidatus Firestonebacteria bacterium]